MAVRQSACDERRALGIEVMVDNIGVWDAEHRMNPVGRSMTWFAGSPAGRFLDERDAEAGYDEFHEHDITVLAAPEDYKTQHVLVPRCGPVEVLYAGGDVVRVKVQGIGRGAGRSHAGARSVQRNRQGGGLDCAAHASDHASKVMLHDYINLPEAVSFG